MAHSKRWTALEIIRTEWAKYGKPTRESIRAFVENRVSKAAHNEAAMLGLKQYEKRVNQQIREQVMCDLGLVKVKGALGGTYWE